MDSNTSSFASRYDYMPQTGEHGGKKATVHATAIIDGGTCTMWSSRYFGVFFDKYGYDNPEGKNGKGVPNWFYYWGKDGAVPELMAPDLHYKRLQGLYGEFDPSVMPSVVNISDAAAEVHYEKVLAVPPGPNCSGGTFGFTARGIDSVAEVIAHERKHQELWNNWQPGGPWVIGKTVDSDDPTPNIKGDIGDMLPDDYETNTSHTDPHKLDSCDLATLRSMSYSAFGDEELVAMKAAQGKKGVPGKDWAYPGTWSTPPYATMTRESFVAAMPSEASGPSLFVLRFRQETLCGQVLAG